MMAMGSHSPLQRIVTQWFPSRSENLLSTATTVQRVIQAHTECLTLQPSKAPLVQMGTCHQQHAVVITIFSLLTKTIVYCMRHTAQCSRTDKTQVVVFTHALLQNLISNKNFHKDHKDGHRLMLLVFRSGLVLPSMMRQSQLMASHTQPGSPFVLRKPHGPSLHHTPDLIKMYHTLCTAADGD